MPFLSFLSVISFQALHWVLPKELPRGHFPLRQKKQAKCCSQKQQCVELFETLFVPINLPPQWIYPGLDFDYLCSKFNRSILGGRWFRSHWKKILINVIFEMSMAALEWAQKSYTVCVLPQQPTTLQVMRSVRKKWVQAWGFVKTKDWAFFSICVLLHFENLTRILYII